MELAVFSFRRGQDGVRRLAALLLLVAGCRGGPKQDAAASAAPKPPPVDDPAVEVGAIIKRDVRIANSCQSADWKWATCHDENTDGPDALKACTETAAKECRDALAKFAAPSAKDSCGKDVESATRRFVEARAKFLESYAVWLTAKRGALAPFMKGKTIGDACGGHGALCKGEPVESDEANFATVNNVECVTSLFSCEPPSGNVCKLPKVACRLGLIPEDNCTGSVKSAKTGTLIY